MNELPEDSPQEHPPSSDERISEDEETARREIATKQHQLQLCNAMRMAPLANPEQEDANSLDDFDNIEVPSHPTLKKNA